MSVWRVCVHARAWKQGLRKGSAIHAGLRPRPHQLVMFIHSLGHQLCPVLAVVFAGPNSLHTGHTDMQGQRSCQCQRCSFDTWHRNCCARVCSQLLWPMISRNQEPMGGHQSHAGRCQPVQAHNEDVQKKVKMQQSGECTPVMDFLEDLVACGCTQEDCGCNLFQGTVV